MKILTTTIALALSFNFLMADGATFYKKCVACHGPAGQKIAPGGGTLLLKDLDKETIISSLKGYKDGTFGGKGKAVMKVQTKNLTDEQIEQIADYIQTF